MGRSPGGGEEEDPPAWVTAAELGEFAFCPRAHHYRRHPPVGAEPVESVLRRAAGRDWHERELARELRAERGGTAGWILAVLGLTLVALAVLASGIVP